MKKRKRKKGAEKKVKRSGIFEGEEKMEFKLKRDGM